MGFETMVVVAVFLGVLARLGAREAARRGRGRARVRALPEPPRGWLGVPRG